MESGQILQKIPGTLCFIVPVVPRQLCNSAARGSSIPLPSPWPHLSKLVNVTRGVSEGRGDQSVQSVTTCTHLSNGLLSLSQREHSTSLFGGSVSFMIIYGSERVIVWTELGVISCQDRSSLRLKQCMEPGPVPCTQSGHSLSHSGTTVLALIYRMGFSHYHCRSIQLPCPAAFHLLMGKGSWKGSLFGPS